MTVQDIKALVIGADPDARHYWTESRNACFTVWREYRQLPYTANDKHVEAWQFQIDRFTDTEFDPVVDAIRSALDNAPGVAYSYIVDYEGTPKSGGLIHHIFDCQG